jgi:hypothetical protein
MLGLLITGAILRVWNSFQPRLMFVNQECNFDLGSGFAEEMSDNYIFIASKQCIPVKNTPTHQWQSEVFPRNFVKFKFKTQQSAASCNS